MKNLNLVLVEDNHKLRQALNTGLSESGQVRILFDCPSGEEALEFCLQSARDAAGAQAVVASSMPDVILMDVELAGDINGVEAAVSIRRELPRMPVVFYSIQDDDAYYRDFQRSGILSHYAYVRKSNYLLAEMIIPLLRDAVSGRSFIDPEIEARVQEVRHKDQQSPMALLEPNERIVAQMLAEGLTNEQIAARLGFRDKRTVSRTNGQIYAAWALNTTTTDEKVARTRAAIIVQSGRLIHWDEEGEPQIQDARGQWVPWEGQ